MADSTDTPRLNAVLKSVRERCDAMGHGAMTDLAKHLGRLPSQVSEYLTTNDRKIHRKPNAEMILAMLEWLDKKRVK